MQESHLLTSAATAAGCWLLQPLLVLVQIMMQLLHHMAAAAAHLKSLPSCG
jgi:hypothetical protein